MFLRVFILDLNSSSDWLCFAESGSRFRNKHTLKKTELVPQYVEFPDGSFQAHPFRKL